MNFTIPFTILSFHIPFPHSNHAFLSPPEELNNINVKYLNSDEPPKFIPTPLANLNPSEIPKLKKISQVSDSFSEAEIQEILKPSFNPESEVISNIDKSSLKFSEQSSIDQITPIPSPRSQKLADFNRKKSSNASRFSAVNDLGGDGNAYDIKHGTCFSTESKPSNSSIPATPDTPQKLHLHCDL